MLTYKLQVNMKLAFKWHWHRPPSFNQHTLSMLNTHTHKERALIAAMMHGHFKVGNVSCHNVSNTSLFCVKSVSLPCPWLILAVSMPCQGIIDLQFHWGIYWAITCMSWNTVIRKYVLLTFQCDYLSLSSGLILSTYGLNQCYSIVDKLIVQGKIASKGNKDN